MASSAVMTDSNTNVAPLWEKKNHFKVVIIGGGMGGVNISARLKMAGFDDFIILERASELGGTWYSNVYPGLTCDVSNLLMAFSWDLKNITYAHTQFCPGKPFVDNLCRVADDLGLHPHIRKNYTVNTAKWDSEQQHWVLNDGQYTAQYLVRATGMLSQPKYPKAPGMDVFPAERQCHTGNFHIPVEDLKGKKVAVVGTAASGMQALMGVSKIASHVYGFMSTPMWIMPRYPELMLEDKYTPRERALLKERPEMRSFYRQMCWRGQESLFPLAITPNTPVNKMVETTLKAKIDSHIDPVKRPELNKMVTPKYVFGGTRILRDTDPSLYEIIQQDNVTLTNGRVEEVTSTGVKSGGESFDVDYIVWATGYHITSTHLEITGVHGKTLKEEQGENVIAYKSITVANYPNMMIMYGPNSNSGHTGMPGYLEAQTNYIMQMISYCETNSITSFNTRPEIQEEWKKWVDYRSSKLSWLANDNSSWYKNDFGRNVTTYPETLYHYILITKDADPEAHTFIKDGKAIESGENGATHFYLEPRPLLTTHPYLTDNERCSVCIRKIPKTGAFDFIRMKDKGSKKWWASMCPCCGQCFDCYPGGASSFDEGISPMAQMVLKQLFEAQAPDFSDFPPEISRQVALQAFVQLSGTPNEEDATITECEIAGAECFVFTPKCNAPEGGFPIFVYMHGGGWVVGSAKATHSKIASVMAKKLKCVVVSIEYKLAPEVRAPGQLNECLDVVKAIIGAGLDGVIPEKVNNALVSAGGDSAGGALAVGVAMKLIEEGLSLKSLILAYPCIDSSTDGASYTHYGDGYLLTKRSMDYFIEHYTGGSEELKQDKYLFPIFASPADLKKLPPTIILGTPRDVLFSQVKSFAKKMREAGGNVTYLNQRGLIHGFFSMYDTFSNDVDSALEDVIAHYGEHVTNEKSVRPPKLPIFPSPRVSDIGHATIGA